LYHLTLGLRVTKKEEEAGGSTRSSSASSHRSLLPPERCPHPSPAPRRPPPPPPEGASQLEERSSQLPARGGLVFKAHRLWYHSTLVLRVPKKKEEEERSSQLPAGSCRGNMVHIRQSSPDMAYKRQSRPDMAPIRRVSGNPPSTSPTWRELQTLVTPKTPQGI